MSFHEKYYSLSPNAVNNLLKLKGPIMVFGAGGFIGLNLLNSILLYRKDVYGISHDHKNNWRFIAADIPDEHLISCDINEYSLLKELIEDIKPKTIFNLTAYGAYSSQKEYGKIYNTNFNSCIHLIELLKNTEFNAFVYAGSSSEYGLNRSAPGESAELIPNSHYAVSKTAAYFAIKYFGKIEKLPVCDLRLYSAFGPWEEPDRLIPQLVSNAIAKKYPPFVNANISRDFVYISDISAAFISAAYFIEKIKGEALNIGTGIKTTIKEIAFLVKEQYNIPFDPQFSSMPDRRWDVPDWYANNKKAEQLINWKPEVKLNEGLLLISQWQKEVDFNNAFWNRTRHK